MLENWKPVVGFEGRYEVSDLGRVKSLPRVGARGRFLKFDYNRGAGRASVTFCKCNKVTRATVAVVVARAFIGVPTGPMVRHLNDDCKNDRVSNLAYGTHMDNVEDAIRNGKTTKGSKHGRARLTEAQVLVIKSRLSAEKDGQIGKDYGVTRHVINHIRNGGSWSWLKL